MYNGKFCGSYLRNHEHTKDFQEKCPCLTFEKVYLPVSRFGNKMITARLNDARPKTGVVSMSTPLNERCKSGWVVKHFLHLVTE